MTDRFRISHSACHTHAQWRACCAGPEHYRTYPIPQAARRPESAAVDTPLSRSTGSNGSAELSYESTASLDSGPEEMPEIPEAGGSWSLMDGHFSVQSAASSACQSNLKLLLPQSKSQESSMQYCHAHTPVLHHLSELFGHPLQPHTCRFQQATRKMKRGRGTPRALEQLRRRSGQTSSCSRQETSTK